MKKQKIATRVTSMGLAAMMLLGGCGAEKEANNVEGSGNESGVPVISVALPMSENTIIQIKTMLFAIWKKIQE